MEKILIIPLIVSFFATLIFIPAWIKKAKQIGLVWEDMHKLKKTEISGSGGLIVYFSFLLGVLIYISIITFYFKDGERLIKIFSLTTSIALLGFIGFIDDLLGWQRGGLSARTRMLLVLFAAIPLIVINVGESNMMGIEFGILYPLFFIPFGIIGASTTFNFLAGYNGLESSQGIIIFLALALVTYLTNNAWLSLICLIMVFSLLGFYLFNKYPAKIFPGDILTYLVGGMIAIIAILGNIEKIAVFFFIPYIIETVFKVRGKLKKYSFGKLNSDGSLDVPYNKFYGLEHISIFLLRKLKGKAYEKDVVYLINFFQVLIILFGLLIFRNILF